MRPDPVVRAAEEAAGVYEEVVEPDERFDTLEELKEYLSED